MKIVFLYLRFVYKRLNVPQHSQQPLVSSMYRQHRYHRDTYVIITAGMYNNNIKIVKESTTMIEGGIDKIGDLLNTSVNVEKNP